MNTINFESAKFQKDLRSKMFPFAPTLPNFPSFLMLESTKCAEITRWSILKSILTAKKVPYNILEGENKNHYYFGLKELLVEKSFPYSLKSLELTKADKELLAAKKKEYVTLMKCLMIIENIFGLVKAKKWKETMATVNLLHETLGQTKVNIDL